MMKKSPPHEPSEACYYEVCGFNLHNKDFFQSLEGAKKNVNEAKVKSSSVHPEDYGKKGLEKVKKEKKSWKSNVITSWWKGDKKKKSVWKSREREIPYMSLHQHNFPRGGDNYGPLYMVT